MAQEVCDRIEELATTIIQTEVEWNQKDSVYKFPEYCRKIGKRGQPLKDNNSAKNLKLNIARFIQYERVNIQFAETELQHIAVAIASGEKKVDTAHLYMLSDKIRAENESKAMTKLASASLFSRLLDLATSDTIASHVAVSSNLSASNPL